MSLTFIRSCLSTWCMSKKYVCCFLVRQYTLWVQNCTIGDVAIWQGSIIYIVWPTSTKLSIFNCRTKSTFYWYNFLTSTCNYYVCWLKDLELTCSVCFHWWRPLARVGPTWQGKWQLTKPEGNYAVHNFWQKSQRLIALMSQSRGVEFDEIALIFNHIISKQYLENHN